MKPALRFLLVSAGLAVAPASAQQPMPVIAVPPLTTPDDKSTGAGSTLNVAWQASQLIAQDLRSTGEMMAIPPSQKDYYSYPEVTAPTFARWRQTGAKALLAGAHRHGSSHGRRWDGTKS